MKVASTEEFDVVVVGGGPAGSTLATLVAMQGHRVLILEKEQFPRYQIGESLLPSTVHGVCRLTGVADELAQAGFTRKRGGTFLWGSNPEPWTFSFAFSSQLAGPTSFAYQVERAKFDKILLDHARRTGAVVREQSAVTDVVTAGDRVTGVVYADAAGHQREITAKYVVDASGNRSRIYSRVGGTREYSEFFRSLALFGYFEDGRRLPPPNSGNIFSVAFDSGWFWYIPLTSTLTSVGAVVRREYADKIQGDPEIAYRNLIAECPLISEYLSGARRVTEGPYGQLRVRKDYSYYQTRFWRPGMVLVGDAACFVDPVFSSGVHLATYSALLAARSINSALAGKLDERTAFGEFEQRYRREYRVFYEFLVSFYNMHVSEDSYFWSAKKVTQSAYSDLESFINLVGGVSSGEVALTAAEDVRRLSRRTEEFAHAVDLVAKDPDESMRPLFMSEVLSEAIREGFQLMVPTDPAQGDPALTFEGFRQAMVDEVPLDVMEPEGPLFPGGLVPSPDGMFWAEPQPATPALAVDGPTDPS